MHLLSGLISSNLGVLALLIPMLSFWQLLLSRLSGLRRKERRKHGWMASSLSMLNAQEISLSAPGASGAAGSGGGGAVIKSEEFVKLQADEHQLAAQHVELYMRYLGRDSRAGEIAFDQEKVNSLAFPISTSKSSPNWTGPNRPRSRNITIDSRTP